MIATALIIGSFAFVVGLGALVVNPQRPTNRACAFLAFLIGLNAFTIFRAAWAGAKFEAEGNEPILFWLRANSVITSLLPMGLWFLLQSILRPTWSRGQRLLRSAPWLLFSMVAPILSVGDTFIPSSSRPDHHYRGIPYYILVFALITALAALALEAWQESRRTSGIRRLELRLLVFGFSIALGFAGLLNGLGNALHAPILKQIGLGFICAALILTAWSLTAPRIIDIRDTLAALFQRVLILLGFAFGSWQFLRLARHAVGPPYDFVLTVIVLAPPALWLEARSRRWLQLGGTKYREDLRREVIATARHEASNSTLVLRFEELLRRHFRAGSAALLIAQGKGYIGGALLLLVDSVERRTLAELGWVTPERLQRMKARAGASELRGFLELHRLGVLVAAPHGAAEPALIVCLGARAHEAPFTSSEIERLQNVAELMDNILTRAQLSEQAALRARMEHLAMMSRGLAHDLKNLITPVSSFLVHFDGRYPAGSAEAEVHAAARRSVRIMTDYVREAMFFAERLEPRFELVELPSIFTAVVEVTAARAGWRGVEVVVEAGATEPMLADRVLLQRLLANLVANAIDASRRGQRVVIATAATRAGWVRLQITDQGCGIAREHLAQIFDPYFTTKEFGEEVRGFGLGLTISQKIVQLHHGSIAVQSELGSGSVFTVDLPRAQKSGPAPARVGAAAA